MTSTKSAAACPLTREGVEPGAAAQGRVVPNASGRPSPPPAAWDEIDATSDASFPASDPPSWTLGRLAHAPS